MNYFDIHSHLYFPDYDADRDEVISRMREQGIYTCSIGTDLESSKQSIALAEKYENIYASVGVHPEHDAAAGFSNEFDMLAQHPRVVAIGECGFDFYRTSAEDLEKVKADPAFAELRRAKQAKVFQAQVNLAIKYNKALMIHARPAKGTMDAYEETLNILEPLAKVHGDKLFGNVHFFVGDIDILKRFLDIGFTVSFTGVITFATDYNDVVKYTPLEHIHAETDAPFVAPVLHRRQRNSPEYIAQIVRAIALIKGEDVETVKHTLLDNAKRLFRLA
jgi:TatD DNase family protein